MLGLTVAGRLFAQDEIKKKEAAKAEASKPDDSKKDDPKKDQAKPDDSKKDESKKDEAKKDETKADEAKSAAAPPPIPPEVEAKLEAARRAVAEAIVAAQDAGLVHTSIDPPPILDILITGRADDADVLKKVTKEEPVAGVSPEVMAAWFTNFGKMEGITAEKNVRIVPPSKGLTEWYRTRAAILNRHLAEVRKARGAAPAATAPKEEAKKEEAKPEPSKEDAKKADAPK
jgi:hypothetical protein